MKRYIKVEIQIDDKNPDLCHPGCKKRMGKREWEGEGWSDNHCKQFIDNRASWYTKLKIKRINNGSTIIAYRCKKCKKAEIHLKPKTKKPISRDPGDMEDIVDELEALK
jgi:hypothetical protein